MVSTSEDGIASSINGFRTDWNFDSSHILGERDRLAPSMKTLWVERKRK
jgi:hypothetical protein